MTNPHPYRKEGRWQPIETAPKDDLYLLGYDPAWGYVPIPMIWSPQKEEWVPFIANIMMTPTHWMPIELPEGE